MYDVTTSATKRTGYPLRPEFAESLLYLFRATGDPLFRQMAAEVIEAIEYAAKTDCGYATVMDVNTHLLEDRMESFFLSETLKYLYLIFAPEKHFMFNSGSTGKVIHVSGVECVIAAGGYIFNTEAHPIDVACVDCCIQKRHVLNPELPASRSETSLPFPQTHSTHASKASDTCNGSAKQIFLTLVRRSWITTTVRRDAQSSNLDFDFMTCSTQSLFSRFSLYGQVARE